MQKFYFTFGSWEKFPHQNGYMVVEAVDLKDAVETFRNKYPDIHKNCLNCSDYYTEERWLRVSEKYYKEQEPKEILVSEKAKQKKRIVVLLETSLKKAMEQLIGTTEEFKVEWLETEIGTSRKELLELGVDIEEVFPW